MNKILLAALVADGLVMHSQLGLCPRVGCIRCETYSNMNEESIKKLMTEILGEEKVNEEA